MRKRKKKGILEVSVRWLNSHPSFLVGVLVGILLVLLIRYIVVLILIILVYHFLRRRNGRR